MYTCHHHARRILSFANPSTVIVTNADNLEQIARFDISPAKMETDQHDSVFWSGDGSMVGVWANCSLDLPARGSACSIHVYDASKGDCLGHFRIPAGITIGYKMSILWSSIKDLLAVNLSTYDAAKSGPERLQASCDMLLFNVVTGSNAWVSSTTSTGVSRMQYGDSHYGHQVLLSCSPDGRIVVVECHQYGSGISFVLVLDTKRLQRI